MAQSRHSGRTRVCPLLDQSGHPWGPCLPKSLVVLFVQHSIVTAGTQKPRRNFERGVIARQADVAELTLIEIGKRAQGSPTAPPFFERCMERQHGVHDQQSDVIVAEQNRRVLASPTAG
jgi:hypothetical protein